MKLFFYRNLLSIVIILSAIVVGGFLYYKPELYRYVLSWVKQYVTERESMVGKQKSDFFVPEGFKVEVFVKDLDDPRVIAFDPLGRMVISEPRVGRITLVELVNGTHLKKIVLLSGLRLPHGLAFYTDQKTKRVWLYVAETHRVIRYPYDSELGRIALGSKPEVIATLPADGRHFTRTIGFGPNYRTVSLLSGKNSINTLTPIKLYISVGSSCDVCIETDWKRAAILESDPEGTFTAEFAGGLRNAVFFIFHPVSKELWATEMGRDNLGDDAPPDEINIVKAATDQHKFGARRYGWPFCYGKQVRDTTFMPKSISRIDIPQDCRETESSHIDIPAHSAPLGLAFIAHPAWPKEWQNDLLVAYHGSWNKSKPTGYKIVRFDLDENGEMRGVSDFLVGFYKDGRILGRPVDLKFGPDGALYISDDAADAVYKVMPTS